MRKRKKRIIIIGNSAAAVSALEAFRKRDRDSRVIIIDKEPCPAYSRVITPYYILGGIKKEEDLFLRTEDFYRAMGVTAYLGREVRSIDIRSRTVTFGRGKTESFDFLLIASGSSPYRPEVDGIDPEKILVLRSLWDAKRLKEIREKARGVVFMGAGLVSLQTLQSMYRPGRKYSVVVKSHHILSQTLDQDGSEIVERELRRMGVNIFKERDVIGWKERDGKSCVLLDSSEEIETEYLFAGKGVRPNVDFLKDSGIEVRKGISVNERMETNIEGVYAAGDVAEAPDFFTGGNVSYGLWPSAVEQGEIAGKNMAGLQEAYPGNLKRNVTRIFAMPVVSIGDFGSKRIAETLVKKDDRRNIYRKLCVDEKGVIIGAILINQAEDAGVIHGLIRERKSADFLKAGSRWRSSIGYGLVYKNIMLRF